MFIKLLDVYVRRFRMSDLDVETYTKLTTDEITRLRNSGAYSSNTPQRMHKMDLIAQATRVSLRV